MGDQHHGARVGQQGILQDVATREVEVVGGLVQDQQVDRDGQCLGQGQTGLLAARQVAHPTVDGIAAESEGGQIGPRVATVHPHTGHRLELLEHSALVVEHLGLELIEVGQIDVGAPDDLPGQRGHIAGQEPHKGGLAGAVRTDQSHLAAPLHVEGDVPQDDLIFWLVA